MEWPRLVEMCEASGETAATLVRLLRPRKADLFIIKPMHSGFYATNLQALLPRLGVSRLVLTGMATELCVLFTAADAHMRDSSLWTPADCVASSPADGGEFPLRPLRRSEARRVGREFVTTCRIWW